MVELYLYFLIVAGTLLALCITIIFILAAIAFLWSLIRGDFL